MNTSMNTGEESIRALLPLRPASCDAGMKDHSSVPAGGGVLPDANCAAQSVENTLPPGAPDLGELAGEFPGGKETVVEGPV
jgi:hypothetical protein